MNPTDVIGDEIRLYRGDCLQILPHLPSVSVDAVVTDPPYAEIDRPYGRLTEPQWHEMMDEVVTQCRRVLKPTGSAVFIIQPNSERVGRMRLWVWEFMVRWGKQWGLVQDAYWWNHAAIPTIHCNRDHGGMRPSVKTCVWLGNEDCYRNQDAVLIPLSVSVETDSRIDRHDLKTSPSGSHMRAGRALARCRDRGGATPFNLMVCSNSNSRSSAGANGHPAGTPLALCSWWVRYLCPPNGVVLDPFVGSGTTGLACRGDREFVGIERDEGYYATALRRLTHAAGKAPDQLFGGEG